MRFAETPLRIEVPVLATYYDFKRMEKLRYLHRNPVSRGLASPEN